MDNKSCTRKQGVMEGDEDTFHVQLISLLHINVSHFLFVIVYVENGFKKNRPSEIRMRYLLGACIITCRIDHAMIAWNLLRLDFKTRNLQNLP